MAENHTEPTVIALSGDIDLLTAPAVTAALDALTSDPHPDLVLDLRPVRFIDCTGLGILCRARHGRLRLLSESAAFLRLLRATGLRNSFEVQTGPVLCEAAG
ncbi:anti-sigma factor antagonist [Streptomyces seoulensis]|uniref:Anti-sigma factor antagonist n=1 Tax=Streptomyces seoulensis TaxID=73044 RepID=A0A4P6U245_STRSO|nr:STAS domain-containing protein [Streptomyces seoulensis]QBJ93262.1 anti-sigma factor antagonist [Streptomyces seoulensis]